MQVSKQVVIGAGLAMVAMVGVIAFLLGRESGRHRAEPPPAVAAQYVPPPPPGAIPQLTGAAPYTMPPAPAPVAPPEAVPAPPMPTTPRPRAYAPLSDSKDEAAQVHEYFLRMGEIQAGPTGEPGEMANKLIASLLNGDASGFDSLVKGAQSMQAAAAAVTPPAPCVAYHQQMLKLLGDSVTLLQQLEPAIKRGDVAALTAVMPTANALQSQTTALESQGRELKARYGLQ